MSRTRIKSSILSLLCCFSSLAASRVWSEESLDHSLKPTHPSEDVGVFEDMVVVQRKAMQKANRFLLSTYGAFDFSDGPYTMYGFHINPGYALSDFWEIYLNFAPFFVNNARSIVSKLQEKGY